MRNRRKGVALVETDKGVLVVRERGNRDFSLPGGGADRRETRRDASMRELKEETGMKPLSAEFLCDYKGNPFTGHGGERIQNDVKVFVVKAEGTPKTLHEIDEIAWWNPGSDLPLCKGLWRTLDAFDEYKRNRRSAPV
jgi:8-oxo-dGTP diphosphatase